MKKILLFVLPLLAFSFASKAQFTYSITADTAYYNLHDDNVPHKAFIELTNTSSSTDSFQWRILPPVDKPADWVAPGVCDWRNCYLFTDFAWHTADVAGNATEKLYVEMRRPNGASTGCSDIHVEFRQKGASSQSVHFRHTNGATLECWPTSTKNITKTAIVEVYPNPTTSVINLNILDKNIKTVQLSNIIGKQIQRLNISNSNGSVHQLSLQSLSKGLYILQFKNESGKILGVTRITKQ